MSNRPERVNPFFRFVIVATAVFIITILALVATVFGDPSAPIARFLNEYGGSLIGIEVVVILMLGFIAMAVDRRQILRNMPADDGHSPGATGNLPASASAPRADEPPMPPTADRLTSDTPPLSPSIGNGGIEGGAADLDHVD